MVAELVINALPRRSPEAAPRPEGRTTCVARGEVAACENYNKRRISRELPSNPRDVRRRRSAGGGFRPRVADLLHFLQRLAQGGEPVAGVLADEPDTPSERL